MKPFWPLGIDPLPLEDSPSHEGCEDYYIEFKEADYGRITALVYDERKIIIDMFTEHTFMDAYNAVREEYPQAYWNPERN